MFPFKPLQTMTWSHFPRTWGWTRDHPPGQHLIKACFKSDLKLQQLFSSQLMGLTVESKTVLKEWVI